MQRHNTGAHSVPDTGADLKVVFSDGSKPLLIEVKGTASAGIAWPQLKVSSPHSHRLLVEERIPVYRVGIFGGSLHLRAEARRGLRLGGRSPVGFQAVWSETSATGDPARAADFTFSDYSRWIPHVEVRCSSIVS